MSYPALIEKVDVGGPTGGADMPGAGAGGSLMEEARGCKEGEAEGGKGELLVKGDAEGNWEEREGGPARELLKAGRDGMGGREVETEGKLMELVPERVRGLDRPAGIGGELTVAATVRGGVGLAGGVVSIPLSSIIFSAVYQNFSPEYSC